MIFVSGNVSTPVPDGDTVKFSIGTGQAGAGALSLINVGASTLTIKHVDITGSADFTFSGPSLPATLAPEGLLNLTIQYLPTSGAPAAATLAVSVSEGASARTYTVLLAGTVATGGSAPNFTASYTDLATGNAVALPGGSAISFSPVNVNSYSAVAVTLSNSGGGSGVVYRVSLTDPSAFQVRQLPVLPLVVAPATSMQFVLQFSPDALQAYSTTLRIDTSDKSWTLRVEGSGIGPVYSYSLGAGSTITSIPPGGAIPLGDAPVGGGSSAVLRITNTGTAQGQISGVVLTDGPFRVSDKPFEPFVLKPGESVDVTFSFSPLASGSFSSRVRIGGDEFTLSGAGIPMPEFQFEGPSGTQQPLQQPAIGITLSEPYPFSLKGTLTLGFVSDVFTANPAIQFSTGGQTAAFTIPANSTQAVFGNSLTTVRIQTGTVAGDLVITPTFRTETGLDVTPPAAAPLNLSIASAAPQLLEAHLTARTTSGFSLTMTGYTTTRSLRQLQVSLKARTGVQLDNANLNVNVESPAMVWFQNANSAAFGGLYSISFPIMLQGSNTSADQTTHIESVAVTVSNELGASNTVTVPLP